MIKLSNGAEIEFLVSSGALAFDGRGWVWEWPARWLGLLDPSAFTIVVKTLTLKPRKGNLRWYQPWGCVRLLDQGVVNAVGLTNPGLEWWIKTAYPRMKKLNYQTVVSVFPESESDAVEMARLIKPLDLTAIELNVSCPNTEHEMEQAAGVKRMAQPLADTGHPLIVKVSYQQPYVQIAQSLEGVAEAVHAINSVPWNEVYPDKKSPLQNLGGGGVSGPVIRKWVREAVKNLAEQANLPIIAGGGIYELKDLEELAALGASAFSFGTLFLRSPGMPNKLVREWRKMRAADSLTPGNELPV